MHMILRFLLLFLTKRLKPRAHIHDVTEISMRVLPTDLDFLLHVNNGVYFSYLDFGRMDQIFRNGVFAISRANGWYAVVAAETIRFKRSLKLWDKFTIQTQLKGHDDKYFYMFQKILSNGEEMASAMIKVRFLKRAGGTVAPLHVMEKFGEKVPDLTNELGEDWFQLEKNYLT